eukprot:469288-Rhodomonas_salina.3
MGVQSTVTSLSLRDWSLWRGFCDVGGGQVLRSFVPASRVAASPSRCSFVDPTLLPFALQCLIGWYQQDTSALLIGCAMVIARIVLEG